MVFLLMEIENDGMTNPARVVSVHASKEGAQMAAKLRDFANDDPDVEFWIREMPLSK